MQEQKNKKNDADNVVFVLTAKEGVVLTEAQVEWLKNNIDIHAYGCREGVASHFYQDQEERNKMRNRLANLVAKNRRLNAGLVNPVVYDSRTGAIVARCPIKRTKKRTGNGGK